MHGESVSVVIPNWNRQDLLQVLLERLARQTLPPAEVVVVDNGSDDDSAAIAERAGARVVRMGTNAGFARAVNRGIEESRGEMIAILNNDVEPEREWLQRLVAGMGEHWFAAGKLLCHEEPARIDGTFDEIARSGCAYRCGHGSPDSALWNVPRKIHFAPLTAALFRKSLFERVGTLDEKFESYLEDVDFGVRCALAGCLGVYVPDATARHRGSATLGAWHADTVRRIARNQLYLVAKHYPEGWFWRHGWKVLAGQGLWGLIALRHGAFGAWLRGKWEGILAFRRIRGKAPGPAIDRVLLESEQTIRDLQQQTGFDRYWKLYFTLT